MTDNGCRSVAEIPLWRERMSERSGDPALAGTDVGKKYLHFSVKFIILVVC